MQILELSVYNELAKHTKVINNNDVGDQWHLHIPEYFDINMCIYDVIELRPEEQEESDIDLVTNAARHSCRPWIDINPAFFNLEPGLHIYKFCFINKWTNNTDALFVSYRIQQDHPKQPYVYMDEVRR